MIRFFIGMFLLTLFLLWIANYVLPLLFPKDLESWWMFKKKEKNPKNVADKAKEAEDLLYKVKLLYHDVDENVQAEIDAANKELREKKKLSDKTKKRMNQISKL